MPETTRSGGSTEKMRYLSVHVPAGGQPGIPHSPSAATCFRPLGSTSTTVQQSSGPVEHPQMAPSPQRVAISQDMQCCWHGLRQFKVALWLGGVPCM